MSKLSNKDKRTLFCCRGGSNGSTLGLGFGQVVRVLLERRLGDLGLCPHVTSEVAVCFTNGCKCCLGWQERHNGDEATAVELITKITSNSPTEMCSTFTEIRQCLYAGDKMI